MFAMELAELPPPTPATAATRSSVCSDTPGSSTARASSIGTSSSSALKTVQLRPPNVATAKVQGSRSTEPTSAGTMVSRNLSSGAKPYAGPRNSTGTDHIVQTEKPMCSQQDRARQVAPRDPVAAGGPGVGRPVTTSSRSPLGGVRGRGTSCGVRGGCGRNAVRNARTPQVCAASR